MTQTIYNIYVKKYPSNGEEKNIGKINHNRVDWFKLLKKVLTLFRSKNDWERQV